MNILFLKCENFKDMNLATYTRHRKEILKSKSERTGSLISTWCFQYMEQTRYFQTGGQISHLYEKMSCNAFKKIIVTVVKMSSLIHDDCLVKNVSQLPQRSATTIIVSILFTNLNRFAIYLNLASDFHHVQGQVANGSCVVDARLW